MKTNEIKSLTWMKIAIIALMLMCFLPMPYGFYNLVRFASMIGFVILAYTAYNDNRKALAVTYGCLALMFQPFIKLALGRGVWQLVDLAVALLLTIVIIRNKELQNS